MTVNGALLARLKAVSGVTDIVGTGSAARIRGDHLDQNETMPAIRFQMISDAPVHAFSAASGLVRSRFQFDCFGGTKKAAWDLGTEVLAALDRWTGTLDSTLVQSVMSQNGLTTYEDDTETYRRMLDFFVDYEA